MEDHFNVFSEDVDGCFRKNVVSLEDKMQLKYDLDKKELIFCRALKTIKDNNSIGGLMCDPQM